MLDLALNLWRWSLVFLGVRFIIRGRLLLLLTSVFLLKLVAGYKFAAQPIEEVVNKEELLAMLP